MSGQCAVTPHEFMDAVVEKFGQPKYDLAADSINTKAAIYFNEEMNSLEQDWPRDGLCWLNPPFKNIAAWAKKCQHESLNGSSILMLVPASVDSTWFGDFVLGSAGDVYFLRPRLRFMGYESTITRPVMLCKFIPRLIFGVKTSFSQWNWKKNIVL